jgi:hypothetical protein
MLDDNSLKNGKENTDGQQLRQDHMTDKGCASFYRRLQFLERNEAASMQTDLKLLFTFFY